MTLRCPNCRQSFAFDKSIFRSYRCRNCDAKLLVSQTYSRMLVLISLVISLTAMWLLNVRKLFYPSLGVPFGFLASLWLGLPVAFLILTVLVRTVPLVIPPKVVLRHWGAVTTLDLQSNENDPT